MRRGEPMAHNDVQFYTNIIYNEKEFVFLIVERKEWVHRSYEGTNGMDMRHGEVASILLLHKIEQIIHRNSGIDSVPISFQYVANFFLTCSRIS